MKLQIHKALPQWQGQQTLLLLLAFALFLTIIYLRESLISIALEAQGPIFWRRPPTADFSRADGLFEDKRRGRHPVIELIEQAEKEWAGKHERASKTLSEAIAEYQRRYKRLPPKGFDDWWNYVQQNDVKLPDEYDSIYEDLEPFWGIRPRDLLQIQAAQENIPDAYIIAKELNSSIGISNVVRSRINPMPMEALISGYQGLFNLLKPVEHMLPPFRIPVSPHDSPNLVSDYDVKTSALNAAAAGKYVNLAIPPKMPRLGFASACPPDSPARKGKIIDQAKRPPPRKEKTFIYDHRRAMDPCHSPHLFFSHAQFLPYPPTTPHAQPLMSAQATYCNTMVHHNIQLPSFISWVDDIHPRENDPPWANKTDERMFWRGSNTGLTFSADTLWRYSQRPQLVKLANAMEGEVRLRVPTGNDHPQSTASPYEVVEVQKKHLNKAFFDIKFAGSPLACAPEYCEFLETEFEWRPHVPFNAPGVGAHKYFIDVDGNGWSSRFKRLITTNSLVFKATIYPEWWLERIQPWVHYVPIQVDLSDLYDIFAFFRGGLYGKGNHDDMARKMAEAGREWSRTYWRKEDMTAYLFRLLLEYGRVMSLDREAMTYQPE
ncbi:Protein O-Glucosyltransferase/Glycosyltransferase 90 [Pleurotus pulmonarius]